LTVDGRIALTALMALSDGHLQKLADTLQLLATSEAARSGDWEQIKGPLGEVGKRNVPALNWFALPDGSYWSVQEGRATGNLDTRTYFPRVLAGHTVLGELVVSKATGKSVAIVAVPVVRPDHAVVGVLGSSVYLDQLSARIKEELGLADPLIFYSFDTAPLLALVYDADLIFADPSKLGEDVDRAFAEMRSHEQGVVTYTFLGTWRTVLYRKSPVTGWWYAFGIAQRD
jgi:methyl-accepting chemotaxis protein